MAMFRQRARSLFAGVDWNVTIAFWLFGIGFIPSPGIHHVLSLTDHRPHQ